MNFDSYQYFVYMNLRCYQLVLIKIEYKYVYSGFFNIFFLELKVLNLKKNLWLSSSFSFVKHCIKAEYIVHCTMYSVQCTVFTLFKLRNMFMLLAHRNVKRKFTGQNLGQVGKSDQSWELYNVGYRDFLNLQIKYCLFSSWI